MFNPLSKLATLPTKQKAMLVLALVIFVIVLYQLINMFGSSGEPVTNFADNKPSRAATVPNIKPEIKPSSRPTVQGAPKPASPSNSFPDAKESAPMGKGDATKAGSDSKEDKPQDPQPANIDVSHFETTKLNSSYLQMLNEIQELKFKQQLYNAQQALFSSEMATLKTKQDLESLKNAANAPPEETDSKQHSSKKRGVDAHNPGNSATNSEDQVYVVKSVTMERDQWHAVLSYGKQDFDVTVGDILSPDNAEVVAIDQKGVSLQVDSTVSLFPFNAGHDTDAQNSDTKNAGDSTAKS